MLENEHLIIKKAQRGESEYFGFLYDHYSAPIYRFIYMKVSNKQEAEDITHEVFLSAWRNIESFNYRGHPFSSWLYQIARNRVIDYYRAKKESIPLEQVNEDKFKIIEVMDKNLDHESDMAKIKKALQQLSEEQQNIIILRFIEDLSPAEISAINGKSEGAIRLIQHRAIQKLKVLLNG